MKLFDFYVVFGAIFKLNYRKPYFLKFQSFHFFHGLIWQVAVVSVEPSLHLLSTAATGARKDT